MEQSARLIRRFLNSRARVMHLGGHSTTSAWLYDIDMPSGWISCDSMLAIDEAIALVIQGDQESIRARARVVEADRREMQNRQAPVLLERGVTIPLPTQYCYRIEFTHSFRPVANLDADRKATVTQRAKVGSTRFERPVLVADVSNSGARILTTDLIESGELIQFELDRGGKKVVMTASGRYARKLQATRDLYSVGLRFENVGRIEAARWKLLVEEAGTSPARFPNSGEVLPLTESPQSGQDLRQIANKLLTKIREVDLAEREFLSKEMGNFANGFSDAELVAFEIQLDVMAQHKRQYADNLASAIEILYSQAQMNTAA